MRARVWMQTMRSDVVPVFVNLWGVPAGTTTTEPGPAVSVRSPAVNGQVVASSPTSTLTPFCRPGQPLARRAASSASAAVITT